MAGAVYATVDDLQARWRPLAGDEVDKATALLADAAVIIRVARPDIDEQIAAGRLVDEAMIVSCRIVRRAMSTPDGYEGVSAITDQAGPFQEQVSFGNPFGDSWLTKADQRLLGCSSQQAFTIDMAPNIGWPSVGF